MASLKEVKRRIVSVESTKKITQARQMISSAKLHQSHIQLDNGLLYKQGVETMLEKLHPAELNIRLPFMRTSGKGKVAIVIMSSNSGMCGAFNANMVKYMHTLPEQYPGEELVFFPIGRKIREALQKEGFQVASGWPAEKDKLADKATFDDAVREVVAWLEKFQTSIYKKVDLVYYRFRSTSKQVIEKEQLLPYVFPEEKGDKSSFNEADYIFEPSREELIEEVAVQSLYARFFTMLLNNHTSEHAARTIAMQLATENADELQEELKLTYNKLRQQNITSELLDIIGSSFA